MGKLPWIGKPSFESLLLWDMVSIEVGQARNKTVFSNDSTKYKFLAKFPVHSTIDEPVEKLAITVCIVADRLHAQKDFAS